MLFGFAVGDKDMVSLEKVGCSVLTMVNLPLPIETISLRGLAVEARFWPRNGVEVRMVVVRAEAAVSVAAIRELEA